MSDEPGRSCAACGAELRDRQRWCLGCGSGGLTTVAPTPRWRPLTAAAVLVTALALAGIGYAVATLVTA